MSQSRKGQPPWNKGKTGCQVAWNKGKEWSKETKDKLSEGQKEVMRNPKHKEKLSLIKMNHAKYTVPSQHFIEIFDGLMLSDSNLILTGAKLNANAYYQTSSIHEEYCELQKELFEKEGFSISKNINKNINNIFKGYEAKIIYSFKSHVDKWLTEQYYRWYPNGEKIIPSDLKVTPRMLLFEFLGDGCCYVTIVKKGKWKGKKNIGLYFSTHSYTYSDCVMFKVKINELGFYFRVYELKKNGVGTRKHIIITTKRSDIKNFLTYIEDCPKELKCFEYKWKAITT